MKVYTVEYDFSERYQSFIADPGADFYFDCKPKPSDWVTPVFYIDEPKLKRPNFFWWLSDVLIMDQKTTEIVQDILELSGQLLYFNYKKEKFTLFHPLHCIDCLNKELSEYRRTPTGEKCSVLEKFVFYPEQLPEIPLFRIPEGSTKIFTVTGIKSHKDEFFYRIQDHNLKGLTLRQVWSDEPEE